MAFKFNYAYIAKLYKVSKPTVSSWAKGATEGKNLLQVSQSDGKITILDTNHNYTELGRLADTGRKFQSKKEYSQIEPTKAFYQLYNTKQQLEILNNLLYQRQILSKFTFFGEASKIWVNFSQDQILNRAYFTTFQATPKLLENTKHLIQNLFEEKEYNLIDLCAGSGENIVGFLKNLNSKDSKIKVKKYVAVDISSDMLDLNHQKVIEQVPKINYKSQILDIENDFFPELFYDLIENIQNYRTQNLVFLTGDALSFLNNPNQTLQRIVSCFTPNTILVLTTSIYNEQNLNSFGSLKDNHQRLLVLPKLLSINTPQCEVEYIADHNNKEKKVVLKMDKDYLLDIKNVGIRLSKQDQILIWKQKLYSQNDLIDLVQQVGLRFVATVVNQENTHQLIIAKSLK
jgi:uncharacterized SAM-dependent methyltransferase